MKDLNIFDIGGTKSAQSSRLRRAPQTVSPSSCNPNLSANKWIGAFATILLFFSLCLASPQHGFAQEFRGTISGTVTDPSGAVVPNATVEIKEIHSGSISRTASDSAGQYVVPFLLPGDYSITASAAGFESLSRGGITLHAQDHPIVDLALTVGSANQTVTVTTAPPQLDLANASVSTVIATNSVADLPLNGRTPAVLSELTPGVITTAAPEQVHPFDNNAGNAWSIGGTPNQVSEVLLDGSPDETLLGALAFSPSQDSVQEVSVQPFATDASFGHTIGGVINQVTKSGSNQFHGTAYEFGQISGIDSNLYFNSAYWNNATAKPVPVAHFNQYGVTFGGPVWLPKIYDGRNKLQFFFAWEGLKDSTPASTFLSVPTTASAGGSPGTGGEVNGDFYQILQAGCPSGFASNDNVKGAICNPSGSNKTAFADPYQVWNPGSSTSSGGVITRTPVFNNQLRSVNPSLDPIALAYMKLYPAPNATGDSFGHNNYNSNAPSADNYSNEFGRVDYNLKSNDHMFLDVRHNIRSQVKNNYFNNNTTGTTLTRENWGSTLDNVYSLNPTTIFDVRLSWMLFYEAHGTPAQAYTPQQLGFPSSLSNAGTEIQLPYINFAAAGTCATNSYECLGDNSSSIDPSTSYQVFTDVVKVIGRHTLKVGFDGRQYRLSVTSFGDSAGFFTFDRSWTNAGTTGTSSNAMGLDLAAFLLGVPSSGQYDLNSRADYHMYYVGTFVQDDFRINDKLTLNMGVRYDINTPFEERLGRTVNGFNPTAAITYATTPTWTSTTESTGGSSYTIPSINTNGGLTFPGGANGAVFATNNGFFSPRFGFSYGIDNKTVVRAGTGLFVEPETMSNMAATGVTSSNALSNQEGFSASTSYVASADGVHYSGSLENPFPSFTQPVGSAQGANTFLGSPAAINFLAPSQHEAYAERWNLGVQRALTNNLMIEGIYVGNHGLHLPVGSQNINAILPQFMNTSPYFDFNMNKAYGTKVNNPFYNTMGTGNTTGTNTTKQVSFSNMMVPFPQFGTTAITEQNETIGQSWFNSLILHVEQRAAHGLTLTANYSFSKMIEQDTRRNDEDNFLETRISPFDHTHHFTTGGTYDLPFGRGKMFSFGGSRLWNEIAGGFVLNGIYQFQSGAPIYFQYDAALTQGTTLRQITNNSRLASLTTPALGTGAFVTSANPSSCTGTCDGSANVGGQVQGNNHYRTLPTTLSWVRQDGYNNLDASLLKNFNFTEKSYFQLRFETFNTLNHPIFAAPNVGSSSGVSGSSFGYISGVTANSAPRQIQIGGRLVF